MERCCANCRYLDFDAEVFPCSECSRNTGEYGSYRYWAANIKDITDPDDKLGAILEGQYHILIEINRLREEIRKLN
jgi:hypothetical protein